MKSCMISSHARSGGAPTPKQFPAAQQQRWLSQRCAKTEAMPVIKVVGIGGSASHTVGRLWDSADECNSSIEMLCVNTDVQELSRTFMPDQDKLLIGARTTSWKGAAGDPSVGQVSTVCAAVDSTSVSASSSSTAEDWGAHAQCWRTCAIICK